MTSKLLYNGSKLKLYVLEGSRCFTKDYIDSLDDASRRKTLARLKKIGDVGPPRNEEQFKHLRDRIFEIKAHQVRIFCFYDEKGNLVLTHGINKPTKKIQQREIEKAIEMRTEYSRGVRNA